MKKPVYTAKAQKFRKSAKFASTVIPLRLCGFLRLCGVKEGFFRALSLILLFCLSQIAFAQGPTKDRGIDFDLLRENMVRNQIQTRGIKDTAVLNAMRKVKRHLFVPQIYQHLAYIDSPLPIGEGQTISQPYIVGLMTELLSLSGKERVLEIGTGSGYQAAILAELTESVFTIEIIPSLAERAERLLRDLGYENIKVKCGDGYLGWKEYAPFDAIMVTCAPEEIPQPLIEQLKDGGRMVIPVGEIYQELKIIEKRNNQLKTKAIIPVRFVPMQRR